MGFGKNKTGAIVRESTTQALGALAARAAIFMAGPTLTEDFRMLKSEITCFVDSLTAGQGDFLQLYLVQSGVSLAQAEAAIETTGPLQRGNRDGEEIAERFVRGYGITLPHQHDGETEAMFVDAINGTPTIVAKPRWTMPNRVGTASWNYMIFNAGATLTTGSTARLRATHYGVWLS